MSDRQNTSRASVQTSPEQAEQLGNGRQDATKPKTYAVSSTWSNPLPVSDRELEVLELYLADALDSLLSTARRPRARGPPS